MVEWAVFWLLSAIILVLKIRECRRYISGRLIKGGAKLESKPKKGILKSERARNEVKIANSLSVMAMGCLLSVEYSENIRLEGVSLNQMFIYFSVYLLSSQKYTKHLFHLENETIIFYIDTYCHR